MNYPYPVRIAGDVHAIYRYLRAANPSFGASRVLKWAKHEAACDIVADEVEWTYEDHDGLPFMLGTLADGVAVAVFTDVEPYEWGDVEPTDDERENIRAIGVETRTPDGETACCKWISSLGTGYDEVTTWGIGYDDRTEDAERVAISYAIEAGMIDAARVEVAEHAYWSARDVETVA